MYGAAGGLRVSTRPTCRLTNSVDHVAAALGPTAAAGAINGLHGHLFRKGI